MNVMHLLGWTEIYVALTNCCSLDGKSVDTRSALFVVLISFLEEVIRL
jgi:hypothetical protein